MNLLPVYVGQDHLEARFAEQRAREAGLSALRSKVVGQIASFKDCWTFRSSLAKMVGASVRTVQRAITQARQEGLIGVARAKKGEIAPGAKAPFSCGFSHRWTIGRGLAAASAYAAIQAAKLQALARRAVQPAKTTKPPARSGGLTDDQRRELERIDAESRELERPPD